MKITLIDFGPLLIGREPTEVEAHWTEMFRLSDHAGYGGAELRAISALDIALWDIKGQQVPVAPHDCTGPVNMFACAQICLAAPNVMIMESNRA